MPSNATPWSCPITTIQDVAEHLEVSWDIIKDIQSGNLQRRFGKPKLKNLKEIAIDEIAIGKGHRYLTVVLNLLSGSVVFVGDGKGVEALAPFWKRLRAARAKVKAVATDMVKAYIRAVRDHLPGAVHVFDHFHVIKLFNEKLSALRRELYRGLSTKATPDPQGDPLAACSRTPRTSMRRDERQRLEDALRLNTPLTMAYYLKEDLRQIWSQTEQGHGPTCPRRLGFAAPRLEDSACSCNSRPP